MPRTLLVCLLAAGCATSSSTPPITTLRDLAMSPNGRYVLLWTSGNCTNFNCRLVARAYDQSGVPTSGDVTVSPTSNGTYGLGQVAISDSGEFTVVYERYLYNAANPDLSDQIFWRKFTPAGSPAGNAVFVDYGTQPDISRMPDGAFAISYTSPQAFGGNAPNTVYVRRYDAAGNPAGSRIAVKTEVTATPMSSQVRHRCDGSFIVAARGGPPQLLTGSTTLHRYDANGTPFGAVATVADRPSAAYSSLLYRANGTFSTLRTVGPNHFLTRFSAEGVALPAEPLPASARIGGNFCGEYALVSRDQTSNAVLYRLYSYADMPFPPETLGTASPGNVPFIAAGNLLGVAAWQNGTNTVHRRFPFGNQWTSTQGPGPAGPDTTLCFFPKTNVGQPPCLKQLRLGAPPVNGYSYNWSPATHLSNPNVADPVVTHPGPYDREFDVVYTLTITGACGCTMVDVVQVQFRPGEL